ncbi:MAG: fimbrillin family protein [Bacteroidales bacterium]|nr:fimbrillin family protein [Bacteroidales bacterium]
MRFALKHTTILLMLCAATAACSKEDVFVDETQDGKIPIELSVGGMDSSEPVTRAVITDGTGKTLNAFDVNTKIFMVMKSEYDTGNPDFAGAQTTKYNVARGDVLISENDNTNNRSVVKFDTKNQRYWDDAHARSSMLSVYAYAQKGQSTWLNCSFNGKEYKTEADADQPYAWTTTEIVPTILTWRASHLGSPAQDATSVQAQDLLFSNNLADNGTGKDKRLKFNFSTRKFPQVGEANMIFYHAMSKITIKIIEGEGFKKPEATASDFKFTTSGGNIILKQFNHTGKFDIKQGEFIDIPSGGSSDIPSIYLKSNTPSATDSNPHYVLEALAVPSIANNGASRIVDDRKSLANDVMVEFSIDYNLYQVTHDDLYEALKDNVNATKKSDNGNYIPLEAGKNYVFTFTVGKTRIKNITAQVVDWEDVDAENVTPSNARITLSVEDRSGSTSTGAVTSDMDIYRALDEAPSITDTYEGYNWTTKYTVDGKAQWKNTTLAYDGTENRWSTDWFWESNKTYYHFRTLSPTTQVVTADAGGDYTAISSASCSNEAGYDQMAWGAPFFDVADDYKFTYSTAKGFDGTGSGHQIYKAIGPTKDQIKVLMFHMFSGVHFTIKTTSGTEKVQLYDPTGTKRTKVDLVGYYKDGKVLLGTGLVNTDGTISTEGSPYGVDFASAAYATEYVDQEYFFSAIPQDLTNVILVITTPDNNQYKVAMKDVKSSSVSNNNIANPYTQSGGKYIIDRWYPGFRYTYSFTLKKTGITDLQATIVDWEDVTAGDDDVKIE